MPFPRSIARFSRNVINPVVRQFAGRLPPFSLLEHTGRRSGRSYKTPIMVFPVGTTMIIALTYGPDTDWAQNAIAAGHCSVVYRHHQIALDQPRIFQRSPRDLALPWLVQQALIVLGVNDFLVLQRVAANA